jgi:phosphoribosyl-AMP cyclohydrolase
MTDTTTGTTEDGLRAILERVAFDSKGLIPAIIQEELTKDVLMLGYMDNEAIRRTLTEGRVTFWSRSRQEYWRKGDTSGNRQYVRGAALDCDSDALLVTVRQVGPACHTGEHACFDVDPLDPVIGSDVLDGPEPVDSTDVLGSEDGSN